MKLVSDKYRLKENELYQPLPRDTHQVVVLAALGVIGLFGVVYALNCMWEGVEVEPGSWLELGRDLYPMIERIAQIVRFFLL